MRLTASLVDWQYDSKSNCDDPRRPATSALQWKRLQSFGQLSGRLTSTRLAP